MMKPFIDFDELFNCDGTTTLILRCAELPSHMYCHLREQADGRYVRVTQANGKGSRRYTFPTNRDEAMAEGRQWAYRKVAEARKAANHYSKGEK